MRLTQLMAGKGAPSNLNAYKLPFKLEKTEAALPKKKRSEMTPDELRAAKAAATKAAMARWSSTLGVNIESLMDAEKKRLDEEAGENRP
jgi:hypothetical protein